MNFIIIAIVIVSIYIAIYLLGFAKVAASIAKPFDTRFLRPVKFINNSNLEYDVDVPVEETSLRMMRGVDDEPGKVDIQVGDLVKTKQAKISYSDKLCGSTENSRRVHYYGRVVGYDGKKVKIQWTYYKVLGEPCDVETLSPSQSCTGKQQCHLKNAFKDDEINEVSSLFGTPTNSCEDCPVTSKMSLDDLELVDNISNDVNIQPSSVNYFDRDFLQNISSSDELMNPASSDNDGGETQFGMMF